MYFIEKIPKHLDIIWRPDGRLSVIIINITICSVRISYGVHTVDEVNTNQFLLPAKKVDQCTLLCSYGNLPAVHISTENKLLLPLVSSNNALRNDDFGSEQHEAAVARINWNMIFPEFGWPTMCFRSLYEIRGLTTCDILRNFMYSST